MKLAAASVSVNRKHTNFQGYSIQNMSIQNCCIEGAGAGILEGISISPLKKILAITKIHNILSLSMLMLCLSFEAVPFHLQTEIKMFLSLAVIILLQYEELW